MIIKVLFLHQHTQQVEVEAITSQRMLRELQIEKMQARLSLLRAERIEHGWIILLRLDAKISIKHSCQ